MYIKKEWLRLSIVLVVVIVVVLISSCLPFTKKAFKMTTTKAFFCGNKIIETGEQCDDGNKNNWDGCNSECTKESAISSRDSDFSANPSRGGYVLINQLGEKSFTAEADTCDGNILLEKTVVSGKTGLEIGTKRVDCISLLKNGVCAYDSELRAYCRNPNFFTTDRGNMKVNVTAQLIQELDRALAEAEKLFRSIATEPGLDGVDGYPVNFVQEKLFQRYLVAFLNGDYGAATLLHTRIMTGIAGSTQDTVRKIDWALAHYYNTLLTNPTFADAQRAGIRGTLAPAISIVEQLQWTGISVIRRQMDRNDIYNTTPVKFITGATPAGSSFYDPSLAVDNPFLMATTDWPVEIGLQVFNYETATLDRVLPRRELLFANGSGSEVIIPASRYTNSMQGIITYLIDERLQGLNDCAFEEVAGLDFFCFNDLIQVDACLAEEGGTPTNEGSFVDPLTPASEKPSFEDIADQTGGTSHLCNSGGGGGYGPNLRAGMCRTGLDSSVAATMECLSNSRRNRFPRIGDWQDQIRQNLQCPPIDPDSEDTRPCEESECDSLNRAAEAAEEQWRNERDRREEDLYDTVCSSDGLNMGCTRQEAGNAVDTAINELDGGADLTVLETTAEPAGMAAHTNFHDTGYEIAVAESAVLAAPGELLQQFMSHEAWHIALDSLGIANADIDGDGIEDTHDAIINELTGGSMPSPDGGSFGGGCTSPLDAFDGVTTCPILGTTPESGGGATAPIVNPLCSAATPAPEGGGVCSDESADCLGFLEGNRVAEDNRQLRAWNNLGPDCPADGPYCGLVSGGGIAMEMLVNIIGLGPDCNFVDAPCNIGANSEGSAAYGADLSGISLMSTGCDDDERPMDSEDGGLCSADDECEADRTIDIDLFGRVVCTE